MFESYLGYRSALKHYRGEIISLEGDIYIVRLLDDKGAIVESSVRQVPSLALAKQWLKQHKVELIEFRQSAAYSEMISLTG